MMYQNEMNPRSTAVLAALDMGEYDLDVSLAELRELADSADFDVLGVITQKKDSSDTGTCLGSGKVEELAQFVKNSEADVVIFDRELTPMQIRNLENACDCGVMDRTMLILDIFASHAVTAEGQLQVELAQLKYQLPRLGGRGVQMSRQGGGGGGGGGARRGAGESRKETDRRYIRSRILALSKDLEELGERRQRLRQRRKKENVTTVAIVGYTNVGKSTLLNTLTQAGVLVEDKLFATLDPTARALSLPDGRQVMLIDTVGLVRRLPHHLVEAFRSTLEEAVNADLILNVCDVTSEEMGEQLSVTRDLLESLGVEDTPILTVLNKCDLTGENLDSMGESCVGISAKTGQGLEALLLAVAKALPPSHLKVRLLLPYSAGELEARIIAQGKVFLRDYTPEGTLLEVSIPAAMLHLVEDYVTATL